MEDSNDGKLAITRFTTLAIIEIPYWWDGNKNL